MTEVTAEPLPADIEAMCAAMNLMAKDWDSEGESDMARFCHQAAAMLRRLAPKVVTAEPVAWRWIRGSYITDWRDLPVPEGFTEEGVIEYAYAHPPVGEK